MKSKVGIIALTLFLDSLFCPQVTLALQPIEITTIDSQTSGYGTFGSYNQHVIANARGYFLTYKKGGDNTSDYGLWRFMISYDGGKTWGSLGEATDASKPPVLETDSNNNVYLATGGTDPYLCKYSASQNFSNPTCNTFPNSPSGKFSLMLDEPRGQLYYFSHYAYFSIFDLTPNLVHGYQLGVAGTSAMPQYPLLTLDKSGVLTAAWTTQKLDQYLYWSIHYAFSNDGGYSWHKSDGSVLQPPFIVDETGPTDRVNLDDELSVHTWLKTAFSHNAKVYLPYATTVNGVDRYHMVRINLNTAQKDQDIPWHGETLTLNELHGFCASKKDVASYPIYCVSKGNNGNLNVVVSYDEGVSWHDYATGRHPDDLNPWSITGSREITDDGYLIGAYTDQNNANPWGGSRVRFFRVKVGAQTTTNFDYNDNGKVDIYDYSEFLIRYKAGTVSIYDYANFLQEYARN